ncbi:unnamed protein product [Acanthoscelides obtectus]|uniref:Uncharacterized protein n=1 Tax=Acanthoscelides obtectus TaxID=200917 RepID=A0A9P0PVN1_ACAOB|nr:unnamed protein product [Acanthoscelides obtectus]CAK1635822.1 hypothetical protein AOBTE_LOCUS9537 [Acanthoscelides obtectus]
MSSNIQRDPDSTVEWPAKGTRKTRKCEVIKQLNVAGAAHTNHKGIHVPARSIGPNWGERQIILDKFNSLSSKDVQDSWLAGLISFDNVKQRRPRRTHNDEDDDDGPSFDHSVAFYYKVRTAGQEKDYILVHALRLFKKVTHVFSIRGHSYLPNDQDFALIEKKKRRNSPEVPEDWDALIQEASIRVFRVQTRVTDVMPNNFTNKTILVVLDYILYKFMVELIQDAYVLEHVIERNI